MAFRSTYQKAHVLTVVFCMAVAITLPVNQACAAATLCAFGSNQTGSSCCAQKDIRSLKTGCCCGDGAERSCDMSQGQGDLNKAFSLSVTPQVQDPVVLQGHAFYGTERPLDMGFKRINHIFPRGQGPPVPLFLLNLSLLC